MAKDSKSDADAPPPPAPCAPAAHRGFVRERGAREHNLRNVDLPQPGALA